MAVFLASFCGTFDPAIRHSNYVHRVTSEVGVSFLSPIYLVVQIQLVQLLVGPLVSKLEPSFCFVWYDLPTNNLTNDPTNNGTNWIWTSKKIGLK